MMLMHTPRRSTHTYPRKWVVLVVVMVVLVVVVVVVLVVVVLMVMVMVVLVLMVMLVMVLVDNKVQLGVANIPHIRLTSNLAYWRYQLQSKRPSPRQRRRHRLSTGHRHGVLHKNTLALYRGDKISSVVSWHA